MEGILLTDSQGAVLLQTTKNEDNSSPIEPALSGVFVMACDQASKLGIGATSSIISYYESHVIVQLNVAPLVLSFVGTEETNIGAVLAMAPDLYAGLEPLCRVIMDFEDY